MAIAILILHICGQRSQTEKVEVEVAQPLRIHQCPGAGSRLREPKKTGKVVVGKAGSRVRLEPLVSLANILAIFMSTVALQAAN